MGVVGLPVVGLDGVSVVLVLFCRYIGGVSMMVRRCMRGVSVVARLFLGGVVVVPR